MTKHLLSRNRFFLDGIREGEANRQFVASFMANMASLGYVFSADTVQMFLSMEETFFVDFADDLWKNAREIKGADILYQPMYVNFPKEVMDKSNGELYLNAVMHYQGRAVASSDGKVLYPRFVGMRGYSTRGAASYFTQEKDINEYTVLKATSRDGLVEIAQGLLSCPTALDENDTQFFRQLVRSEYVDPSSECPHKERLAVWVAAYDFDITKLLWMAAKKMKTVTDVLRLAACFSGSPTTLIEKTRFKLDRRQRKIIVLALNKVFNGQTDDFYRHRGLWLALFKHIHIGEFQDKIQTELWDAIALVRREVRNHTSYRSRVEKYLRIDPKKAVELLSSRPGEFARRLVHLTSVAGREAVIGKFHDVASELPITMIIQMINMFRSVNNNRFVISKKGTVTKLPVKHVLSAEDKLRYISILCDALISKLSQGEPLGAVWVDPALEGLVVPLNQRNAVSGIKTLYKGSWKNTSKEHNAVRLFAHWKNIPGAKREDSWGSPNSAGRVDLDLSCSYLNKDLVTTGVTAYFGGMSSSYCAHSGDITDASGADGAAEFIDFYLDKLPKEVAYVVMTVNTFSGQHFNAYEASAGFMDFNYEDRQKALFVPVNIQDRFRLIGDYQFLVPMVYDVERRRIIWVDTSTKGSQLNIASANNEIKDIVESVIHANKMSIQELVLIHIVARNGHLVSTREEADVVFDFDSMLDMENVSKLLC